MYPHTLFTSTTQNKSCEHEQRFWLGTILTFPLAQVVSCLHSKLDLVYVQSKQYSPLRKTNLVKNLACRMRKQTTPHLPSARSAPSSMRRPPVTLPRTLAAIPFLLLLLLLLHLLPRRSSIHPPAHHPSSSMPPIPAP